MGMLVVEADMRLVEIWLVSCKLADINEEDYLYGVCGSSAGGCLNGGRQIRPKTWQSLKELSRLLESDGKCNHYLYWLVWLAEPFNIPIVRGLISGLSSLVLTSEKARRHMYTQYHPVDKSIIS
ncbi:hypothetical protein VNO77_01854 [Canavalia gladiata]|uniref:Uncharacterized protein n=1 Tax=Canavalia gladiata TaxID=3824 RepID=A0AAN9MX64_CANGL